MWTATFKTTTDTKTNQNSWFLSSTKPYSPIKTNKYSTFFPPAQIKVIKEPTAALKPITQEKKHESHNPEGVDLKMIKKK